MKIDPATKVFITGCGGMLGQAVYRRFSSECIVMATDIDLCESWLEYADVRDLAGIREKVISFAPNLLINLAALTDLEYCERNVEDTWKTNALGPENMALIARQLDIPLVHISTAGVFDGSQEYFNDFDRPNPLSVYAKSKYYAEGAIERMLDKYYIFRAGWMMGGGPSKDKKFINKIFKQLVAGARTLKIVDDKLGTPTYTVDFADNMFEILSTDYYGLYNMVCGGSCSRYDVAREFVAGLGLSDKIEIELVDSSHFGGEYFAPRPSSEKLVNLKLETRGINRMRDWKTCLDEYTKEYRAELDRRKLTIISKKQTVSV